MLHLLLFFTFLKISIFVFAGGSSSSENQSFLRDQFVITNTIGSYKIEGNNIEDPTFGFNIGTCGDNAPFNVCSGSSRDVSCCIGTSSYGYDSWVAYAGKDSSGHRLLICFAYPDPTLNTVSYRCQGIHPSDGSVNVNLGPGMTINLSAKLVNIDFFNPGWDSNDFDSKITTGCGCKDTTGNVVHCAGYTLLQEALNDCLAVESTYSIGCAKGESCPCDANCQANNFVPTSIFSLTLEQQSCYLCNKPARAAAGNCQKIKQCFDSGALDGLKAKLAISTAGYGNGLYVCGYMGSQRVGCAKAGGTGGPRHFPRTIFCPTLTSSDANVDLKLCPGFNVIESLPFVRAFRDYPISSKSIGNTCVPPLNAELGYQARGTFFRPKLHIQYNATDVLAQFIPNYMTSPNSSVYAVTGLNSANLDSSVTDTLSATAFSSRLYRIKSSSYSKDSSGNCSLVYSDQYYDIAVRLEYNQKINESQVVAYVLQQTANNIAPVVDNFTGELVQYSDTLNASDFIDSNVQIINMDGSLTPFQLGKQYYIQRIGSVPRPPLRHYYIGGSLLFPLSIEPDTLAVGGMNLQYVNPYRISVIPSNSVNPSDYSKDLDYYLPQDSTSVYVAKSDQLSNGGAGNLSNANCGFIYGSYFCAKIDYCSMISMFQNTQFLLNPPNNSYCAQITDKIKKYECYMAGILVPICNNRVFCDQSENIEDCKNRLGIKLYLSDPSMYKFNKSFQDEILTCINGNINYDHVSQFSDITRYGPFGDAVYDTVISFIRQNNVGTSTPLITRPITNYSPYINSKWTNADLYKMKRGDFKNATVNNISTIAATNIYDNLTWVLDFINCSKISCIASNIKVRSIDADELPRGTMCTSLMYNSQTSIEFSKSRQKQYHDYDLYVPLRCQFLTAELIGAGGGGCSEKQGYFCNTGSYIDAELPAVSASGCSGGYISGNIKIDDGSYQKDYLGIQVGERTRYCEIDNSTFSCGELISNHTDGKFMAGGCHDFDGKTWRGNSAINFFNSAIMDNGNQIATATKGRSQIDLLRQNNYHRITVDVSDRDNSCIINTVFTFNAGLIASIPATCLTYGISSSSHPIGNIMQLNRSVNTDICLGQYLADTDYFSTTLTHQGGDAQLSSGRKRLFGTLFLSSGWESFVFGGNGGANIAANQTPQLMTDLSSNSVTSATSNSPGNYFNIDNPNPGSGGAFNAGNAATNFKTPPVYPEEDVKIIFDSGPAPNYTVYSCNIVDINNINSSVVVKSEIFSCGNLSTPNKVGNYNCKITDRNGITTNLQLQSPIYCQDTNVCSCTAVDANNNILIPPVSLSACSSSLCGLNGQFCISGDDCKALCPIPPSSIQIQSYTGGVTNSCKCPGGANRGLNGNYQSCVGEYSCFECVYLNPNIPWIVNGNGSYSINPVVQADYTAFVSGSSSSGISSMPISTNRVSYQTGVPTNSGNPNQNPINPSSNNSNSYKNPKYSGGGGTGKVIISSPLIKHVNINKPNMHPYFINGQKKIGTGSDYFPDMDCKFRCPKMNVLFHNVQINLMDSTRAGDLLCEYSAFGNTDMEVPSYSNYVYPMKCYIISNNSGDKFLQSFHGSIISSDICPVSKCTNGMILSDNRLYGMCQYNAGDSSSVFYHKAIQSSGNISTNAIINGAMFFATFYDKTNSIQLASCTNTNIDQIIISEETLNNDLLAMKCVNGSWEYQVNNVIVNENLSMFQKPYYTNDGNNTKKTSAWGLSQVDQGRTTDLNAKESLSYYQEISLSERRAITDIKINSINNTFTLTNKINCPPLINAIDYDSGYTGNAIWDMTPENTIAYASKCRSGFSLNNIQLPTRKCRANGIWGPIKNPCV